MSLRVRMGLAAGVAVALAVIAVAFTAYAGTRSQLRGQVDQSLQSLAQPMLMRAHGLATPGPPSGQAAPSAAHGGRTGVSAATAGNPDNDQGQDTPTTPAASAARGSRGAAGSTRGASGASTRRLASISAGLLLGVSSGDCDHGLGIDDSRGAGLGGPQGYVQLVSSNAKRICLPRSERIVIPITSRVRALARSGHGHYLADAEVGSTQVRTLVYGLGSNGALMVALPLTDVDHALSSELLLLMLIAAGGILLAGVLGLLVARTALAPIARFTRQTEAIAQTPERIDHQRLDVHGSDELARLGQTFNRTLDALEESVQAQRNLVADASHELRTPIATIRANLQLMRDEQLLSAADREALRADVIEELDELTALVGDVVELARGSKPSGELGDLRLDEIVAEAIERTRRRAPQLTVAAALEPTLIRGEGDRISRAVSNLLDNAVKWSPPGAAVEVVIRAGVLSVRDHGPGFQEEDLPFIFDRFHRARNARSKPGSGLGLAIVRQAAEAHGGFVEAANAPDGGALMRVGFGPRIELAAASSEEAVSAAGSWSGSRPAGRSDGSDKGTAAA